MPQLQPKPYSRTPGRHPPSLQRGYECYQDGTVDRSRVEEGKPDESKFTIMLPSRKRHPRKPEWIQGKGVTYQFPHRMGFTTKDQSLTPFDWNNKKHIKALHQWREQIFRRRIGGVRATRPAWLELEKQKLLQMIEEQLKIHRRPRWNRLTNEYNRHFQGQVQLRGEKQVFGGRNLDGRHLAEDRAAPWRTRSALEGQTFKWREYHDLLDARDMMEDAASDASTPVIESDDDEEELPDPSPVQTEFKPRKVKLPIRRASETKAAATSTNNVVTEAAAISSVVAPGPSADQLPSAGTKRHHSEGDDEDSGSDEAHDDKKAKKQTDDDP